MRYNFTSKTVCYQELPLNGEVELVEDMLRGVDQLDIMENRQKRVYWL